MQLMEHSLCVVQMVNMQFHMDKQVILRKLCCIHLPIHMYSSDRRPVFSEIIYHLCVEMKTMQSRTRKRDPPTWKKAIKERNREAGKEYMD